ncbi:adenylate/guanylate cyclase domain-containing protein [Yeosuana sp. MJ-SS3]|uniref:Adenylate/guanylate cyclase domain-containing protein n=1 Tax=Gilvirhabdus luticola TaxID=3079858 RepID=A0ABU3UAU8_9FLAO|nr:adenylate/guanylate cyclase domain-containing protein [Yeosuana sp. MJ-SS3]MDU8887220.1 adenylate/guanylate cyclase domain-containing protein [Yeosuana sp. MJ-SS3]
MSQKRQLAAIMFTDIEGYTALMQNDEKDAVHIRFKHREIFNSVTEKYGGEIIQYYGDGTLSIFSSSVEAIKCGIEMQRAFQKEPSIPVRIGVHVGDIIRTESDIIGDAVNVASRIESLAAAGSILISGEVNDQLRNQNDINSKFISNFEFKNVDQIMPVFAIANQGIVVPKKDELSGKTKEKESQSFKAYKRKSVLVTLGIVAILVALFYYYQSFNSSHNGDVALNRSIAVLPFSNMSNDTDSENFTDGVTEDILLQLSKIKELQVISRASIMQFKESNLSISDIAKELGVSYVLEGSVRKYGDKVRINAQLIDAQNNNYLWAENYDKTLTEIFEIQSQVSNEIARALKITLSENEILSLNKLPTESSEAYNYYKEAQMFLNRGGGKVEELEKAKDLFEKAIDIDPSFCRAYVGLSDTYLEYIYWGREAPKEILEKALTPALKALELSPAEGGSYGALGSISYYRFEKETAVSYLEKAIEINPNYVGAYDKLAWIRLFEGNLKEAVRLFNKVLELDPLSTKNIANIAFSHYYFHEYDKGIKVLNDALKRFPEDNMLLFMKGNLLTGANKYEEAIKVFNQRTVGINTNWMLAYAYAKSGQTEKAKKILNYLLEKHETTYVPPYMIATIYMGLGDKENTLTWLEKDYNTGGLGLFFWGLKRDVKFNPIKDEPRFVALLNKIK